MSLMAIVSCSVTFGSVDVGRRERIDVDFHALHVVEVDVVDRHVAGHGRQQRIGFVRSRERRELDAGARYVAECPCRECSDCRRRCRARRCPRVGGAARAVDIEVGDFVRVGEPHRASRPRAADDVRPRQSRAPGDVSGITTTPVAAS